MPKPVQIAPSILSADFARLADEVAAEQRQVLQELARLLDVAKAPAQAVGQVRALMFIEKFAHEVQHGLDAST